MPILLRLSLLLLFWSSNLYSQEKMTLANQITIPATSVWTFPSLTYGYSGATEVQIGNNGTGGTLLLQVKASNPTFYIGGTVYLFLDDGNVITCTDKNVRSISGSMIQAYYILTPSEIRLLKKNKITDVRLRILGNETQFSSSTGFFTSQNKIKTYGFPDKSIDTVSEIKQLFNSL
jgi:hypothetical protein